MHAEHRPIALGISFVDLLRYNAEEAGRWQAWLAEQPPRVLDLPFGDDARRMGRVRDMIWHLFIVEWIYARVIDGRGFDDWGTLRRDTLDDLFAIGSEARGLLNDYLARATPAEMDERLEISGEGATIAGTRRKFLTHTFVHSARHWAQISTVLRQHGCPTNWQHDFVLSAAME